MPPEDALLLSNWWVTPFDAQIRQGWQKWSPEMGEVTSLCAYNTPSGTNVLFAATADAVWNVSTQGSATSSIGSLSSGYWQHCNYSNSAGTFLYMVNGLDAPMYWNGSTWTNPSITGVTAANLIHVTSHKTRLWFIEKSTLKAWYLPTNAVAGAANVLDLRAIFKRGGYLESLTTWTIDAGQGMDDYLVFVTNRGEVAVYKGTDPASADTWALTGVWQLGEPLGRRCFIPFGGDVCYLSKDGISLLSSALISSRVNTSKALSLKIQSLISQDTSDFGANQGWQMLLCPQLNMLLVNVPTASGNHQWAMNTISKCWTRFDDVNAVCWELWNDEPYFGHATGVGKFWTGWSDNIELDDSGGENINYNALQSFQSFGNTAQLKRFTMVKPVLQATGIPSLKYTVNTDLNPTVPTGTPSFGGVANSPQWGSATWGAFKWGGTQTYLLSEWQAANAIGYTAALYLRGASKGLSVRWGATNYLFERGGVI